MLAPIAKVLWSESHQKQLATLLRRPGQKWLGPTLGGRIGLAHCCLPAPKRSMAAQVRSSAT